MQRRYHHRQGLEACCQLNAASPEDALRPSPLLEKKARQNATSEEQQDAHLRLDEAQPVAVTPWEVPSAFASSRGSSARGRQGGLAASPSAWREREFSSWLEQKLAAERLAVVTKLQKAVSQQLANHHKALLEEVEGHLCLNAAAVARPMDASSGKDLSPAVPLPAPSSKGEEEEEEAVPVSSKVTFQETVKGEGSVAGARSLHNKSYKGTYFRQLDSRSLAGSTGMVPLIRRIVGSKSFEITVSVLIILNTVLMAAEVQYIGCDVSNLLGHADCTEPPGTLWPDLGTAFTVMAVAFAAAFALEFVLRLAYLEWQAFRSAWMWFDFVLLVFGLMDVAYRIGGSLGLNINPGVMRTARIARMLRMLKVLQTKNSFQSLYLLLKSIGASRHALVWSLLLLYFTMMSIGMLINQMVHSYLVDASIDITLRREVYDLFGTYTRTVVTMFEITLGNWAPPSRVLMVNISQWWGVFIVSYRCILCFALVHVTAAVFITETTRVASDDQVALMRKKRADAKNRQVLIEMFNEIDMSGDGLISFDEFKVMLQDKVMQNALELLGLEVRDVEELFALMDEGSGGVEQEKFVKAVLELRGHAKNMGQRVLMRQVESISNKLDRVESIHAKLDKVAGELSTTNEARIAIQRSMDAWSQR